MSSEWRVPAACALVVPGEGTEFTVDRVHLCDEEPLTVLALARVLGLSEPTGAIPLAAADLDAAITLLAELEHEDEPLHPAARAWHYIRERIPDGAGAVAVFVERLDLEAPDDPATSAVLAHLHRGRVENADGTTILWRPVGPAELELLTASAMRRWPPRLPDQPIFYPVLNEPYARQIAEEWNVPASGSGFVTRFEVATTFARRYPTRQAGGPQHLELWIPASDIDDVNRHLRGRIDVVDPG
jgi:hypothetical protein